MTLILFTQSYPYDFASEHIFIEPEIRHLVERWNRVILVPRLPRGNKLPLPNGSEVDEEYAGFLQPHLGFRHVLKFSRAARALINEIRDRPTVMLYPSKILKLILFSARVELTGGYVKRLISSQQLDPSQCMLYSYWLDHAATALANIRRELPGARAVSRAHGYDIYEEYYYPYYWPYRRETLQALDAVFFASDAGRNYCRERYPEFTAKYETAHLGTRDPGFISRPSADGVFRIVSCAHIVPVKRVGLLLEGVAEAARRQPEHRFEWIHFGDGTARKSLEKRLRRTFPPNAQGRLPGDLLNPQILRHYRDQPVDVFVNVSSTEGGAPVAIQEAISCGIPVVAAAVGGNPEVVSKKNGILLSPDPNPQEIAAALLKLRENPGLAAQMREESRRLWESSYNAEVNFRLFAERLKSIGER